MPGFTITRGFGPGATPSAFIALGFVFKAIKEVVKIFRGGRSEASRAIKDIIHTFKISAMLIQVNGKEKVQPIFNRVSKTFNESLSTKVNLIPQKLIMRRSEDLKVEIKNIKVRKKDGRN